MAGSRSRHQERADNSQQDEQVEEKKPIDGEHTKSATDSIRNFFQNIGTKMDDSDHVGIEFMNSNMVLGCGHSPLSGNFCQQVIPRHLCSVFVDYKDKSLRPYMFSYLHGYCSFWSFPNPGGFESQKLGPVFFLFE